MERKEKIKKIILLLILLLIEERVRLFINLPMEMIINLIIFRKETYLNQRVKRNIIQLTQKILKREIQ
jgi:hypothetical protein